MRAGVSLLQTVPLGTEGGIGRWTCVVRFVGDGPLPQNPALLFQVTVCGDKLSKGGLIRLGETGGDELMGWFRRGSLEVVEVLGELFIDGKVYPITEAVG